MGLNPRLRVRVQAQQPVLFLFVYLAGGDQVSISFNSPKGILLKAFSYITFVFQVNTNR